MKEIGRKAFFRRYRHHFGVEHLPMLSEAYQLGKAIHRPQVRKTGERYIGHPKGVALILMRHGCDPEDPIIALLHDSLEDGFLLPSILEKTFGDFIADGVKALTKYRIRLSADGEIIKMKKTTLEYEHALSEAPVAWRRVKCADRIHNLSSMLSLSVEFRQKQVTETRRFHLPLAAKTNKGLHRSMASWLRRVERSLEVTV